MRRRFGFVFICVAALPIAIFASTAWACGALTTLSSSATVAAPGQSIEVTGRNFSSSSTFTPVEVRWNSRTGPVLAGNISTGTSNFTEQVTIPASATPGWYVINATQYNATTGVPKAGSPGRTTVRVQGAAVGSTAPWGLTKPTGGSGGPGSPELPLPAIFLSVGLLAAGVALARGKGRKATRPVLGV